MGDMADDYIRAMEQWGPRLPRRGSRPLRRDANATVCKFCGSTAVHWRETELGWRLFDDKRQHPGNRYVEHDCTPEPTADGFEDEPT